MATYTGVQFFRGHGVYHQLSAKQYGRFAFVQSRQTWMYSGICCPDCIYMYMFICYRPLKSVCTDANYSVVLRLAVAVHA